MSLKRRIAIFLALAFSVLFGTCLGLIYVSFASFRQEEFQDRLEQKAITTAKILLEIDEISPDILRRIDQNSVDKLFREHTLIYNQNYELLYNSKTAILPDWNESELKRLRKKKRQVIATRSDRDILAIYYDFNKEDYFVIISAYDIHGINKLDFLWFSLLVAFFSGIVIVWVSTYFIVKRLLKPLDDFQEQITQISVNELNVQLEKLAKSKEINLLTEAFNRLLQRLEKSFVAQKEFTAHASHELRTPLTRIAFQLENLDKSQLDEVSLSTLERIQHDVYGLSELLNSLLLLSQTNLEHHRHLVQVVRVDELLFNSFEVLKKQYAHVDMVFEIGDSDIETTMEIKGLGSLLEIVFLNLLRNGAIYSFDHRIQVVIQQEASALVMRFSNSGNALNTDDLSKLFQPFKRLSNANGTVGFGLGLVIVQRILEVHQASITYEWVNDTMHCFEIRFPTHSK